MPLGCGEEDSQDADELEDGPQEQAIPQQALQEGGFRDLRRGQVQLRSRHDGADRLSGSAGTAPCLR